MDTIQKLLLVILHSMVKDTDAVELHVSDQSDSSGEFKLINVKVATRDLGVCIGKEGMTAEAIRRIIGVSGMEKLHTRIVVKIDAPRLAKNHFYNP
jgi:predicted RNA-binding protein YlqC (UPF0109 family)